MKKHNPLPETRMRHRSLFNSWIKTHDQEVYILRIWKRNQEALCLTFQLKFARFFTSTCGLVGIALKSSKTKTEMSKKQPIRIQQIPYLLA